MVEGAESYLKGSQARPPNVTTTRALVLREESSWADCN